MDFVELLRTRGGLDVVSGAAATPKTMRRLILAAMMLAAAALWGVAIYVSNGGRLWKSDGVVAVFSGGNIGRRVVMSTPFFMVEHDWAMDIELDGTFRSVKLTVDEYRESELLDGQKSQDRIQRSWSTGGAYQIRFDGDGAWRVTIKQEHP